MREDKRAQPGISSSTSLEQRVPADHPLRAVRKLTDAVLATLSPELDDLYEASGRPSIAPEYVLRALLLQVFYSVRSERLLVEQIDFNLLFRWFVGLGIDDAVWNFAMFSQSRVRLLTSDVAQLFFTEVNKQAMKFMSDEHFTVDLKLIHAWASQKSESQRVPRSKTIAPLFSRLRTYLFEQTNQATHSQQEQDAAFKYMIESGEIGTALRDAGVDDETVLEIERYRIRPLAFALKKFALRGHLTFAKPLWGWWMKLEPSANEIYFSGGTLLEGKTLKLCAERKLTLAPSEAGWGVGQVTWNRLRRTRVGIFDLTRESKTAWPQICHTLGSALALGIYPVVVIDADADALPFDIDVTPVRISRRVATKILGDALDKALFGVLPCTAPSSVDETTQRVLSSVTSNDAETYMMIRTFTGKKNVDPIEADACSRLLAKLNGPDEWAILNPVWPALYPDGSGLRCFHIMPFSQTWSDRVRDAVRGGCRRAGARYRRGDETENIQVIRSIWEEICRATHIIVDLTGMNMNVCLELALAQALGRPTLLVSQEEPDLFPEIAKLQVKRYSMNRVSAGLSKIVTDFVAAEID